MKFYANDMLKRLLSVVMCVGIIAVSTFLLPKVTAKVMTNEGKSDDFETCTLGNYTFPTGLNGGTWVGNSSWNSDITIAENPFDATLGKSVYVKERTAVGGTGLIQTQWAGMALQAEDVVISFKVGFNEKSAFSLIASADRTIGAEQKTKLLQTHAQWGLMIKSVPDASIIPLAGLYDKMHRIDLVIHTGDAYADGAEKYSSFDAYVNGVLIKENQRTMISNSALPSYFHVLNYIQFEGRDYWLDDLRCYTADGMELVSSTPESGSSGVDQYGNVTLNFNSVINPASATASNITVSNGGTIKNVKVDGEKMTVSFEGGLEAEREYTVEYNNITDIMGHTASGSLTFTTAAGIKPVTREEPFADSFEDYEAGEYANAVVLNSGKYSNATGGAAEIKTNELDASLGKSIFYGATAGNITTMWDDTKSTYMNLRGSSIVISFKAGFVNANGTLSLVANGRSDTEDGKKNVQSPILRAKAGEVRTGYANPNNFALVMTMNDSTLNKMHQFDAVIHTGEAGMARYDIYVDGERKIVGNIMPAGTNKDQYVAFKTLNYIEMSAANAYIDDIKCYTIDGAKLQGSIPSDGNQNAACDDFITVMLSDTISTSDLSGIVVADEDGTNLFKSFEKVNANTARLYLTKELSPQTAYSLRVSGLKDVSGNTLPSSFITFKTGDRPLYEFGNVVFSQGGTNITETGFTAGTVSAAVDVSNISDDGEVPCALVLAVYRGGRMTAVNWDSGNISVGEQKSYETEVTVSVEEGCTISDYSICAYIWQDVSAEKMKPLTDKVQLKAAGQ